MVPIAGRSRGAVKWGDLRARRGTHLPHGKTLPWVQTFISAKGVDQPAAHSREVGPVAAAAGGRSVPPSRDSKLGGGRLQWSGRKMKPWIVALIVALAGPAVAQHHQHGQQPYASLQQRTVKALSDQQMSDLRAGRGMGLALAAELNGYPGPLHVIELADRLQLTSDQRVQVQRLYEAMKAEARPNARSLQNLPLQNDRSSPTALADDFFDSIGHEHAC